MKRDVVVVIPVYRPFTPTEEVSFRRCVDVLGGYDISVIQPESLAISYDAGKAVNFSVNRIGDKWFKSVGTYNFLMLSSDFYNMYSEYEYMLIYQLDAYVFRDELQLWCGKGYDYVGAPWLVRPLYKFPLFVFTSWLKRKYCEVFHRPNSQQSNFKVGNGGFSLRKVESHLEAVTRLKPVVEHYLAHPGNHIFNEDVFFAVEVNRQGMHFSYPDYREALEFSFDKYPALCYEWNGRRLPFGCHGWYKRKMKKFWFAMLGLQGV